MFGKCVYSWPMRPVYMKKPRPTPSMIVPTTIRKLSVMTAAMNSTTKATSATINI